MRITKTLLALLALAPMIGACDAQPVRTTGTRNVPVSAGPPALPRVQVNLDWRNPALPFGLRLSAAAEERARHAVVYDAAYVRIPYPMGDVAADRGVCSDEIVRAYRLVGIDLQQLVHEDMRRAFQTYPRNWGLARPDTNIDHRRVPNLATYFRRRGASLPVTQNPADYLPGDVVAWALSDGRPHIGLVTQRRSSDGARPLVMHNIGWGPQIEDMLFGLTITGHFRFQGTDSARPS